MNFGSRTQEVMKNVCSPAEPWPKLSQANQDKAIQYYTEILSRAGFRYFEGWLIKIS